jgi:PAS domain S-box-containing protein
MMPAMASPGQDSEFLDIHLLVDSIPALIHTARPDGYLDYFNKPWLEYLGVTLDKVAGWNWTAYVHPEDVEGIVAKWRASLATGEIFEYETRVRRADGEYRWMLHRKVALRDSNGNIVKWYGSSLDIEERKTAEEALRNSQAYLAEAQNLSHTGSFSWKVSSGEIFWSDEACRIFQCDPGTRPTVEFILSQVHPDDRDVVQRQFDRASRGGGDFEFEHRLQLLDAPVKHVRVTAHPSRDKAGNREFVGAVTDVSEQREAEAIIREGEKQLRQILDLAPQHLAVLGPDGTPLSANRVALEYFGVGMDQWRDEESRLDLVHPADRKHFLDEGRSRFLAGTPHEFEARLLRHDGQFRCHLFRLNPDKDERGHVRQWYGAATDIEDHKRAEVALQLASRDLQESKAKLEEAQRVAHVGYWEWDLTTDQVIWSDETYRIYGLQPRIYPMDSEAIRELVHPGDREFVFSKAAEVIRGEARADIEHRIVRPSGEVRVVHSQGDLKRDASGRPWQMFGMAQDITERKRAEEALRLSESYLAETQKLTRTGSWVWSVADRSASYISDEWYRVYGFNPAEGPPNWEKRLDRVHAEDRLKWRETIDRAILEKADYDVEFRILLPDGKVKWIHTVGHPVLNQAGNLVQFLGSSTDISERKNAEEALNKVRSEFAYVARVTTLNSLTASIAHELNQPLSGIITNASTCLRMLEGDSPNVDGARETARRIIRDGNRASDVISRLRVLFSKKEFTLKPLDLNEATREVIALSLSDLQRNRVILRSELAEDLPLVIGDRVQLQQVILNLVRNASDAMVGVDGRPKELLIQTGRDQGDRVHLSVSDAGVGLTPEGADKLFEAFYTTKTDGMGIGLSVSRSIIERHHGRLWAEPNGGPGATFSFSIPCAPGGPGGAMGAAQ